MPGDVKEEQKPKRKGRSGKPTKKEKEKTNMAKDAEESDRCWLVDTEKDPDNWLEEVMQKSLFI